MRPFLYAVNQNGKPFFLYIQKAYDAFLRMWLYCIKIIQTN